MNYRTREGLDMTKFVVYWEDPEDCDTGFEEFANEQHLLEWANSTGLSGMRTRVFEVRRELKLKPRQVATEFVLDYPKPGE